MNCDLFPGFQAQDVDVGDGVHVHTVTGGDGPALLLLHGYPQTHVIWHRVAPALAQHFRLVLCDLRGYGDSSKPPGGDDHAAYSKRAMAADVAQVMRRLGHERFAVLAHDRGARVAHRLAMDQPQRVGRLVLLDIAPTLSMYQRTSEAFARAYWHWFFLIQAAPLPERAIQADTAAWLQDTMARRFPTAALPFDPRAWAEYERCIALPGAAHAMCEDYRASAGIDLVHDRADREAQRRLAAPLLVLWGRQGVIERCFDPLAEWRAVADNVQGAGLPCGHYLPEEAPEDLLRAALPFLQRTD